MGVHHLQADDSPASPPPPSVPSRAAERLELLERAARADGDAGERRLGEVGGYLRLVAQPLLEPAQQGASAGEQDAALDDV